MFLQATEFPYLIAAVRDILILQEKKNTFYAGISKLY